MGERSSNLQQRSFNKADIYRSQEFKKSAMNAIYFLHRSTSIFNLKMLVRSNSVWSLSKVLAVLELVVAVGQAWKRILVIIYF